MRQRCSTGRRCWNPRVCTDRTLQVGRFSVSTDAESARDGYLAAVEDVISRIDHGRFYQLNLCIRLHAAVGSAHRSCSGGCANSCSPRLVV